MIPRNFSVDAFIYVTHLFTRAAAADMFNAWKNGPNLYGLMLGQLWSFVCDLFELRRLVPFAACASQSIWHALYTCAARLHIWPQTEGQTWWVRLYDRWDGVVHAADYGWTPTVRDGVPLNMQDDMIEQHLGYTPIHPDAARARLFRWQRRLLPIRARSALLARIRIVDTVDLIMQFESLLQ